MHARRLFIVVSLLTALALLVNGQTASGAIRSPAAGMVNPETPTAKIEAGLLSQLESGNPVDFLVRFVTQADLSPAYSMGWNARGEFVYHALNEAASDQRAAKAYLDQRGVEFQTFLAGNELYVFQGLEMDALALANLVEISGIRLARTYPINPFAAGTRMFDLPIQPPDGLTWPVTFTKADQFWNQFGVQGEGVVVAGIDTGVQWDHEALDQAYKCSSDPDNLACWYDPGTIDCTGTGGGPCDTIQHGTATMGPMVADDDPALTYEIGMAPGAQWIACLGCPNGSCSDYDLNACADWIIAPGGDPGSRPDIVNNSWGGPGNNDWFQYKVLAWEAAGIFPTFSPGGEGPGCGTVSSPGDYPEVFTSGAIDETGTISPFSARGPSQFGVTKPNIASPGVNIWTTIPDSSWANYNGTSFSSAYSAGAVALLWSCNPEMQGDIFGTFQMLQENADYIEDQACGGEPGQYNNVYGYGNLDILAAGQSGCSGGITRGVLLEPETSFGSSPPGTTITYTLSVSNTGNTEDTYTIDITGVDAGWSVGQPVPLTIPAHAYSNLEVVVLVPPGFDTDPDEITITVTSTSDATVTDSSTITTTPLVYWLFMPAVIKQ